MDNWRPVVLGVKLHKSLGTKNYYTGRTSLGTVVIRPSLAWRSVRYEAIWWPKRTKQGVVISCKCRRPIEAEKALNRYFEQLIKVVREIK